MLLLTPILIVPVLAGLLCLVVRPPRVMAAIGVLAFSATLGLGIALVHQVLARGVVTEWREFLSADALSAWMVLLISVVSLATSLYAGRYFRRDVAAGALTAGRVREFFVLTPLFGTGMFLVVLANNLGVMWAAMEITTLVSVFLVTFYGKVTSLEAAWKYAIIGGVGVSMALFGTLVAYYAGRGLTGSEGLSGLNWSVLAQHAAQLDKTSMRLAFVLVLMGYGTKAGLAPMHTWKPDAYSEAPVPTTAILSTALLNCALYCLIRYYILTSRCLGSEYPGRLLLLFGLLSMGVSVPFVLVQKNFRRLLAYSTIDHAGIMAIALGIGGAMGSLGLMLHMVFHTIAKSLLFLCAGNVYQHFRTDLLSKIKGGVMRAMPLTGVVLFMAMLAITGMPPFSLFQSEFLIVRAAIAGGHVLTGVLFVLFGTGLFTGALLFVGDMVLGPRSDAPTAKRRPWRDGSLLALASVLVVIAFWVPTPLLELVRQAAHVVSGQ